MNKRALEILDYYKIIEFLRDETTSAVSANLAEKLVPLEHIIDIGENLRSTTEAVDLIVRKGAMPTDGIKDIENCVKRAGKGGILSLSQLLMVKNNLQITTRVINFMKGDLPELPRLRSLTDLLVRHEFLEKEIDRCILTEDEVSDKASKELFRIRRAIIRRREEVRMRLEKIASGVENQPFLQDSLVTVRDGRFVIPVKSEHKNRFPGIVHDQSRGGATLFVEPQVIVNMNNELKELQLEEEREVTRILKKLSERVGECRYDISNAQKVLAELDLIMAKGKLSIRFNCAEPEFNKEGILELKNARHPLLDQERVVPVNVAIGEDYHTLVITGPNTGGKTLTLKTIGLLCMMAQSGLHIPASHGSRLPVYRYIFADIGDEQSIEQNLSTFSSHMKNIVFVVNKANSDTLVLLDELGAGTDPTEGAALAISILEELAARGASTVATTHYNELKKYALSTDDVENASMEFDMETLSPTYRLLTGVPGRSNAFEISKKLGLSTKIIDEAARLIDRSDVEFEDVVSAIDEEKRIAEKERREAEALKARIAELKKEADQREEKLREEKEKLIVKAKREARAILRDARETADQVQKVLNAASKEMNLGNRNRMMAESKGRLREKEERYSEKIVERVNSNPVKASEIQVGDNVKLLSLNQNGRVLSKPDEKGELMVQVGIMKMNASLDNLILLNDGSSKANKKKTVSGRTRHANSIRSKAMRVSTEVDVRGQNADDARMEVRKYLDDAYLGRLSEVTIIHGRGTGVLKTEIRKDLRRNRHVDSFRPGAYNEGGEGVTIVRLRNED